jgi:hypothetical protein
VVGGKDRQPDLPERLSDAEYIMEHLVQKDRSQAGSVYTLLSKLSFVFAYAQIDTNHSVCMFVCAGGHQSQPCIC